jgi:hypothetical protein
MYSHWVVLETKDGDSNETVKLVSVDGSLGLKQSICREPNVWRIVQLIRRQV